jgi:Lactate racemase N-terminal domain
VRPDSTGDRRRRLHEADSGGSGPAAHPRRAPSCRDPCQRGRHRCRHRNPWSPGDSALRQKLGEIAWSHCRVHLHDDQRELVHLGRDSCGTPVLVNRHVAAADYIIGIGGVYPQNSTGFGGGAKLALGVLGRRSIVNLHYGNPSEQGSYNIDNDFRRELDEIANMVRPETSVCLHVDAHRQAVRITTGDHRAFYRDAVTFARGSYRAAPPQGADLVVANAYPMDLSLTFLRSKAITPLLRAAPGSSRVLIAGCPEGLGRHGLYPFLDRGPAARLRHLYRHLLVHPRQVPRAAASKAAPLLQLTSSRALSRLAGGRTRPEGSGWGASRRGQADLALHPQRRAGHAVHSALPDHGLLGRDPRPDRNGTGGATAPGGPLSLFPAPGPW